MDTAELSTLEYKLALLDQLLEDCEERLRRTPPHASPTSRSYPRQELESERHALKLERTNAERRIRDLRGVMHHRFRLQLKRRTKFDAETTRAISGFWNLVAEQVENGQRQAQRHEASGDYRAAKIRRLQLIDVPQLVAHEYPRLAEAAGIKGEAPR